MRRRVDQLGAEVWALKEWLTPADLALLERAGVLEVTARHGERIEYRIAPAGESLLRQPTQPRPHQGNRPDWAYRGEHTAPELRLVE